MPHLILIINKLWRLTNLYIQTFCVKLLKNANLNLSGNYDMKFCKGFILLRKEKLFFI